MKFSSLFIKITFVSLLQLSISLSSWAQSNKQIQEGARLDLSDPNQRETLQRYIIGTYSNPRNGFLGNVHQHIDKLKQELQSYPQLLVGNEGFVGKTFVVNGQSYWLRQLNKPFEAPFLSGLGTHCGTQYEFNLRLERPFYTFTVTDSYEKSKGSIFVALGSSQNPETGKIEKTALLEEVDSVLSNAEVPYVLELLRQMLLEKGYLLSLPGKGYLNGSTSNDPATLAELNKIQSRSTRRYQGFKVMENGLPMDKKNTVKDTIAYRGFDNVVYVIDAVDVDPIFKNIKTYVNQAGDEEPIEISDFEKQKNEALKSLKSEKKEDLFSVFKQLQETSDKSWDDVHAQARNRALDIFKNQARYDRDVNQAAFNYAYERSIETVEEFLVFGLRHWEKGFDASVVNEFLIFVSNLYRSKKNTEAIEKLLDRYLGYLSRGVLDVDPRKNEKTSRWIATYISFLETKYGSESDYFKDKVSSVLTSVLYSKELVSFLVREDISLKEKKNRLISLGNFLREKEFASYALGNNPKYIAAILQVMMVRKALGEHPINKLSNLGLFFYVEKAIAQYGYATDQRYIDEMIEAAITDSTQEKAKQWAYAYRSLLQQGNQGRVNEIKNRIYNSLPISKLLYRRDIPQRTIKDRLNTLGSLLGIPNFQNELRERRLRWWDEASVAVQSGDIEKLKEFQKRGFDLSVRNSEGKSLYWFAAKHNQRTAFEFLAEAGTLFASTDMPFGESEWMALIEWNKPDFIEQLKKNGANLNFKYKGDTPLHEYAKNHFFAGMLALIQQGADPSILDNSNVEWDSKTKKYVPMHVNTFLYYLVRGRESIFGRHENRQEAASAVIRFLKNAVAAGLNINTPVNDKGQNLAFILIGSAYRFASPIDVVFGDADFLALKEIGLNFNAQDILGNTPLHYFLSEYNRLQNSKSNDGSPAYYKNLHKIYVRLGAVDEVKNRWEETASNFAGNAPTKNDRITEKGTLVNYYSIVQFPPDWLEWLTKTWDEWVKYAKETLHLSMEKAKALYAAFKTKIRPAPMEELAKNNEVDPNNQESKKNEFDGTLPTWLQDFLVRLEAANTQEERAEILVELKDRFELEAKKATGKAIASEAGKFLIGAWIASVWKWIQEDNVSFDEAISLLTNSPKELLRLATFAGAAGIGSGSMDVLKIMLEKKYWKFHGHETAAMVRQVLTKKGLAPLDIESTMLQRIAKRQVGFLVGIIVNRILWGQKNETKAEFLTSVTQEFLSFGAANVVVEGVLAGSQYLIQASHAGKVFLSLGTWSNPWLRLIRGGVKLGAMLGMQQSVVESWDESRMQWEMNRVVYGHLNELEAFLSWKRRDYRSVWVVGKRIPHPCVVKGFDMSQEEYGLCWVGHLSKLLDEYMMMLPMYELWSYRKAKMVQEMELDRTYGVDTMGEYKVLSRNVEGNKTYLNRIRTLEGEYQEEYRQRSQEVFAHVNTMGHPWKETWNQVQGILLQPESSCQKIRSEKQLDTCQSGKLAMLEKYRSAMMAWYKEYFGQSHEGERGWKKISNSNNVTGIDPSDFFTVEDMVATVGYYGSHKIARANTRNHSEKVLVQTALLSSIANWMGAWVSQESEQNKTPLLENTDEPVDRSFHLYADALASEKGFPLTKLSVIDPETDHHAHVSANPYVTGDQDKEWTDYIDTIGSSKVYYENLRKKSVSLIVPENYEVSSETFGIEVKTLMDRYKRMVVMANLEAKNDGAGPVLFNSTQWVMQNMPPLQGLGKYGIRDFDQDCPGDETKVEGGDMSLVYKDRAAVIFQMYKKEGGRSTISDKEYLTPALYNFAAPIITKEQLNCMIGK